MRVTNVTMVLVVLILVYVCLFGVGLYRTLPMVCA